jgi:hypothetical protein
VTSRDVVGGESQPATVWWLVAVWMVLTVGALLWVIPHQEADLEDRARAKVGDEYVIDVDGRDALLRGDPADSVLQEIAIQLRGLRGLRSVVVAEPAGDSGSEHEAESDGEAMVGGLVRLADSVDRVQRGDQ